LKFQLTRKQLVDAPRRLALITAITGFVVGVAVLDSSPAHSIGGLCNGRPASRPWLDASGQAGPAVLDGTRGDDVIIGSDGDDTIDGRGGNDTICGGPGNDSITVGPGGNSFVDGGTGDNNIGTVGTVHSVTLVSGLGNSTLEVGNTVAPSYLYAGPGNNVLIHNGRGHVKMVGGRPGFNDCIAEGGDELVNCDQ